MSVRRRGCGRSVSISWTSRTRISSLMRGPSFWTGAGALIGRRMAELSSAVATDPRSGTIRDRNKPRPSQRSCDVIRQVWITDRASIVGRTAVRPTRIRRGRSGPLAGGEIGIEPQGRLADRRRVEMRQRPRPGRARRSRCRVGLRHRKQPDQRGRPARLDRRRRTAGRSSGPPAPPAAPAPRRGRRRDRTPRPAAPWPAPPGSRAAGLPAGPRPDDHDRRGGIGRRQVVGRAGHADHVGRAGGEHQVPQLAGIARVPWSSPTKTQMKSFSPISLSRRTASTTT